MDRDRGRVGALRQAPRRDDGPRRVRGCIVDALEDGLRLVVRRPEVEAVGGRRGDCERRHLVGARRADRRGRQPGPVDRRRLVADRDGVEVAVAPDGVAPGEVHHARVVGVEQVGRDEQEVALASGRHGAVRRLRDPNHVAILGGGVDREAARGDGCEGAVAGEDLDPVLAAAGALGEPGAIVLQAADQQLAARRRVHGQRVELRGEVPVDDPRPGLRLLHHVRRDREAAVVSRDHRVRVVRVEHDAVLVGVVVGPLPLLHRVGVVARHPGEARPSVRGAVQVGAADPDRVRVVGLHGHDHVVAALGRELAPEDAGAVRETGRAFRPGVARRVVAEELVVAGGVACLVPLDEDVGRVRIRGGRGDHHPVGVGGQCGRVDRGPGRPAVGGAVDAVLGKAAATPAQHRVGRAVGGEGDVGGAAERGCGPAEDLLPGGASVGRAHDGAVGRGQHRPVRRVDGDVPDDVEELVEGRAAALGRARELGPRLPAVGGLEDPLADEEGARPTRGVALQLSGAVVPHRAVAGVLRQCRHAGELGQVRGEAPAGPVVLGEVHATRDASRQDALVGGPVEVEVDRERPRPPADVERAALGPGLGEQGLGEAVDLLARWDPLCERQLTRADVLGDAAGARVLQPPQLILVPPDRARAVLRRRRRPHAGHVQVGHEVGPVRRVGRGVVEGIPRVERLDGLPEGGQARSALVADALDLPRGEAHPSLGQVHGCRGDAEVGADVVVGPGPCEHVGMGGDQCVAAARRVRSLDRGGLDRPRQEQRVADGLLGVDGRREDERGEREGHEAHGSSVGTPSISRNPARLAHEATLYFCAEWNGRADSVPRGPRNTAR